MKNYNTKTFIVRLCSKYTEKDEQKLNLFLDKVNIVQMYTNIVDRERAYFSYSINYVLKNDIEEK